MIPFVVTETRFNAAVQRLKRQLPQCGANAIRHLSQALKIDRENSFECLVDADVFRAAAAKVHLRMTDEDVEAVFGLLKLSSKEGSINCAHFISVLRYEASPLRWVWLQRVWGIFAKDQQGRASLQSVQTLFQPNGHPDVICGRRSAAEVREEWLNTFNEELNPQGNVTSREFAEVFSVLSSSVFDDETYLAMLRGCWPIPGVTNHEYTVSLATGKVKVSSQSFSAHQDQLELNAITRTKRIPSQLVPKK